MWFWWWFILVCDLIVPVMMVISGRMMWKRPPKNINGFVGYRTTRSMKNMDTWKFAHDYYGRLCWKIGLIMLILSIVVHLPFYNEFDDCIGIVSGILCTVQCVVLIGSIVFMERVLKRTFTDDGTRKLADTDKNTQI